jgi:cob(I)alamin adenosyltransferase
LALGSHCEYNIPQLTDENIAWLEGRIDALQDGLKPIEYFTIPGGCELSSLCHICRTVCRRAERRAIEAAENYEIESAVLVLLNRLSDYLYALCRTITERLEAEEVLWRP